jgi:hypothetical protein
VYLRRAAVLSAITTAAIVLTPAPAGAHGSAAVTIHAHGAGAVWVTAEWADGHPITDSVAAVLTASSGTGQRIGPVPLRRAAERSGAVVPPDRLGAGDWQVEVDMAAPALGHCQTALRVGPGSPASEKRCAPAAEATPAPVSARDPWRPVWLVLTGLAPVAAVLVGLYVFRRRLGLASPARRSGLRARRGCGV